MVEIADNAGFEHVGIHIMTAGLGFQVASLVLFLAFCAIFAVTCIRRERLDERFICLRSTLRFRVCLWGESM
jgi:hypothetical protein